MFDVCSSRFLRGQHLIVSTGERRHGLREGHHQRAQDMTGVALRFRDQKGRCFYCRRAMSFSQECTHPEGRRVTREHLIPRSKGGKGGANVVAACYRCNSQRGDKPWLSFYCSPAISRLRLEALHGAEQLQDVA